MKSFIILFSFSTILMAQTTINISHLTTTLDSLLRSRQGTFAVAFSDVTTGEKLYINEHEVFHAASTMKVPVMIEAFSQAEEKKLSLDDSVMVENYFRSIIDGSVYSLSVNDDSEDGLYHRIGHRETIRNLIFKMITVSSNLATNILIGIVGPDNIMRRMKKMGIHELTVLRGVEDTKAFDAGKNNTTTAFDLSLLFEQIAAKTAVSEKASVMMRDILLAQKFSDMIPAKLPSSVIVAHKTGSITNVQHDAGIIYLPDGHTYILVLLSKNLKSNADGIQILSAISKIIYDYVVR